MEKICPKCGKRWNVDDLITDPDIEPIGMIIKSETPLVGVYFFVHNINACQTTFAIPVEAFSHFLPEVRPLESQFGSALCGGHCRKIEDLSHCTVDCKHAPFRKFIIDLYNERRRHSKPPR